MAYFFRLPLITDLTIAQQAALNETNAIAISGGPGTGKSVVSLWRHIRNYKTGSRKSLLLTYTKTLEKYLSASSMSEDKQSGEAVDRILRSHGRIPNDKYDEIIIDEAQDVPPTNHEYLKGICKIVSYGADDKQILYPNKATTEENLSKIFPNNSKHLLDENFRNSYEIMQFTKALFPNKLISQNIINNLLQQNRRSNKPILLTLSNQNLLEKAIIDIINLFRSETHNIAILFPFEKGVIRYFELIKNAGIECSIYVGNENGSNVLEKIENVHITTLKSAKGIEFDTVILPEFNEMENFIGRYHTVEENDYYVAITRAKSNLYLLSFNIPNFLQKSEQQKQTYQVEVKN